MQKDLFAGAHEGAVYWERTSTGPKQKGLNNVVSLEQLPFNPVSSEFSKISYAGPYTALNPIFTTSSEEGFQATRPDSSIIKLRSTHGYYLDQDDISNLAAMMHKVSQQKTAGALDLQVLRDTSNNAKVSIGLSTLEVGLFGFLLFGFLVVATYILHVQFIHPALGLVCTFGSLAYLIMGWRDNVVLNRG